MIAAAEIGDFLGYGLYGAFRFHGQDHNRTDVLLSRIFLCL